MNIEDALTDIAESLRVLAKNSELARAQCEEVERTLCMVPDEPAPEKPKKAKREKAAEPTPETDCTSPSELAKKFVSRPSKNSASLLSGEVAERVCDLLGLSTEGMDTELRERIIDHLYPAQAEPTPEPTPEPAETLTLDYLRENWGKRIAQAGKAPDTKPWMNERDATSLSTLDPKYYPEFVEFAKSLLGE